MVTNGAGHPAQQGGHLRAGQDITEDVVDEQQHVTAFVTEIFGHRQTGQGDPEANPGGLIHLAENHRDGIHHAVFLHFVIQVGAFTGAFAHTGENGNAGMLAGHRANQLGDGYGFTNAGTAINAGLTTPNEGGDQVDNFHAGFECFDLGALIAKGRRIAMNRIVMFRIGGGTAVNCLAGHVKNTAECYRADRDFNWGAGHFNIEATGQTVG